jgi:hypothetical protein
MHPHDELEDPALIDRIIALRAAGWTFERIGAQLKSEGFDPKDPEIWQAQILRRLVQQRDN